MLYVIADEHPVEHSLILRSLIRPNQCWTPISANDVIVEPRGGVLTVSSLEGPYLYPLRKSAYRDYYICGTLGGRRVQVGDGVHTPNLEGLHTLLRGVEVPGRLKLSHLYLSRKACSGYLNAVGHHTLPIVLLSY